jgi:hypothetical protein
MLLLIVPQLGLGSELDKHLPTPVTLPHTHTTNHSGSSSSSSSSGSSSSSTANSSIGSHTTTRTSTQQPAAAAVSSCKSSTVKTSSQSPGCETTEKDGKERAHIVPHSVSLGACHTAVLMYNSAIAGAPLCMLVGTETVFIISIYIYAYITVIELNNLHCGLPRNRYGFIAHVAEAIYVYWSHYHASEPSAVLLYVY